MQRYFLEKDDGFIKGLDYNHIVKVMRMKTDDQIITCYNKRCFLSKIKILEKEIKYDKMSELTPFSFPNITIVQGLPKNPKSDLVVKYQTIFGASEIILIPMKRSITKLENEQSKLNRLNLIAKEAAELSHRFDIPKISYKKSIKEIDFLAYDMILLADENEKIKQVKDLSIDNIKSSKILVIIGPEGGISDDERSYLKDVNCISISLGNHILPTEIASLYVLSYFSAII
jgi:16S rRNA (uracil1498-N3)-methyltransferase